METSSQKKSKYLLLFIIACALYLIATIEDSARHWYTLLDMFRLTETRFHSLLTLGGGVGNPELRWRIWDWTLQIDPLIPFWLFNALPGVFFAIPPILSLIFVRRQKRILSLIFAIVNLILALISVIAYWYLPIIALCCGLYIDASVLLLLRCLSDSHKKLLAAVCFALAAISLIATVLLSFTTIHLWEGICWNGPINHARYGFLNSINNSKMQMLTNGFIGTAFYPISRTLLLMVFGVGFLFDSGKKAYSAPAASSSQTTI